MKNQVPSLPVALTVAGFDGSGGAGVLADCRTFNRMGIYGVSAITAVVAESPGSVSGFEMVSPKIFQAQLKELIGAFPLAAAKTGLLGTAETIELTADFFKNHPNIPLVTDPVLSATAGAEFSGALALEVMCQSLFPRVGLLTPNVLEAEAILGIEIRSMEEFCDAAKRIFDGFGCPCLLKGGHFQSDRLVFDVFQDAGGRELLDDPRLDVPDLHGTGCTLSAAITAGLACRISLRDAILQARRNLRMWMENYHSWSDPREIQALNSVEPWDGE